MRTGGGTLGPIRSCCEAIVSLALILFQDEILCCRRVAGQGLDSDDHLRKFQVMPENCRKISRYAGQEFHLMPESSA